MPVSLTTITGPIYLPNGATPVGGRVSFELSSWDQEEGEGLIISGPVYTTIDSNGQFSVELYTSTAGINSVHYRMFVIWEDSELSESYVNDIYVGIPTPHYTKKYIGSFALSGPGPFQVSDLNIISETNNSSFDAYLEMKAFVDRIDLGVLDAAVQATEDNAALTLADRNAVTPLAAQVVLDAAQVASDRVVVAADAVATAADRVLAQTVVANAQASAYTTPTWTALSTITGTLVGQGAEVLDADTGTHTDPVVGGTVANAGRFTWSASPAGWQWIGATGLAGKASKVLVDQDLTGQVVGTSAAASGSTGSNNSFYYWPGTQKTYDQLLTQIEIGVSAARVIQVAVARVEGDGSLTLVAMHYATTAVGANTLPMNVFVPAGCVVGIGNMASFYFDATTGLPLWNTAAAPTTSTAKTIGTTTNIHHKLTLIGATAARAKVGLDGAVVTDSEIGVDVHGLAPLASGTTANNATCYFWPDGVKSYDQALTRVEVAVTTARTAAILVAQVNGDGTLTLVSSTPVTLATGVNSVAAQVFVPAGCIVGLGNLGTYYYSAIAPICWTTAATPTTSTAKSVITANAANMRLTLAANTKAKAELGYASAAATAVVIGAVASVGWPSLVATGSNAPTYTVIPQTPALADGRVTRVQVASNASGAARIFACTIGAGPIATITAYQDVTLAAGLNDIPVTIPITAGQYAGIYAVGTVGLKFQNSTNPLGIAYWYQTSLPAGSAVITSTSHRFELALTIKTGLQAGSGAALPTGTGLDYFEAADKTGVTDVTALLATAKGGHPAPYIPPGDYAVTILPASGGGLWGPGRPFVNGTRFFLPTQPRATTLLASLRAAFAEHITNGDVLTLIGDSISHWAHSATGASHWFNRLTAFANLGIAADEPIMTALRSSSTYTPAFYGLTISGGTGGTIGPLGESLILAAADYIEFTGAYEQVDVFAKQVAGAGTLSITYNGGAAFGTKSYAGATTLDVISGFPATGQAASGTYRISASGGPVELTGLIRLGVNSSTTAVAPRRLRAARASHGSYTFANFNPTAIASILKQATYAGGKCVPIIALGINDSFGTTPENIVANAASMLDNLEAGGVTRMFAILPIRPSSAWNVTYTGGRTFDAAIGPLRALYRARGVTILPVDAMDWVAEGLLSDGLHPNDLGHDKMAQIVVESFDNDLECDQASIDLAFRNLNLRAGLPIATEKMLDVAGSISPTMYRLNMPITSGVVYEHVIIASAADYKYLNLFVNTYLNWDVSFDLVAGTFIVAGGAGSMTYLGGGMYECIARGTANTTGTCNAQVRPSPAGVRPYTGDVAKGLIVDAMVFRVFGTTTNLYGAHTKPSDAYFTKTSLTVAAANTAPTTLALEVKTAAVAAAAAEEVINGTNTLWSMTEAVAGTGKNTRMYQAMTGIVSGSSYKVRIRGKAGTRGRIGLYSNSAILASVSINLANGVSVDHGAATVRSTRHLLNGTWECDVTIVAAASGSANLQIWTLDASSVPGIARTSDGTSLIYIKSVEVFKDSGSNILLSPTDFAAAEWIKDPSMTLTSNAGLYLGVFGSSPSATVAHPLAGKKVAVVGTSLVVQGLMTAAFAAETGAIVQALGYSGGSLGLDARGSPHYGSGQVTALLTSIAADTNAIIIDMLVNDVAAADVPLGAVTDTTTATYRGALANAFAWCETNRPGASVAVVVQTAASATYPTGDYRHGVANANGNFLSEFQEATRQMCDQYGRAFIDPNRFGVGFLDSGDDTSDGLHWDASGASRVAKIYAKSTRELCEAGWLE